MHKLLQLAALTVCALSAFAAPVSDPASISITNFKTVSDTDGSYAYDISQDNGVNFQEEGVGGQEVHGSFSYTSPEGVPVFLSYSADAYGFHPQSDLLPTPPPIPQEILEALELIKNYPTPEELADRQVRDAQLARDLQL